MAGAPARSEGLTRVLITISVMLATVMNSLDTTIANVALPHIQGSVSAAQDQITWVLTSYIVAAAIMTPLTGWLAGRFGQEACFPRLHRRLRGGVHAVRHRQQSWWRSCSFVCCKACSARR